MTRVQVVGAVLIALGLVYALLYVGWLRRSRRKNPSVAADADAGLPRAMTMAWVEGTYISTTMAISRHERVAAAGMGARARATMIVDEISTRWELEGVDIVRVSGTRLLGVSLERGVAGKLLGHARIVLVSWHADNGDRYTTSFLPRRRADSAALVQAVQRLMRTSASIDDAPPSTTRTGTGPQSQTGTGQQSQDQAQKTPDGPL